MISISMRFVKPELADALPFLRKFVTLAGHGGYRFSENRRAKPQGAP